MSRSLIAKEKLCLVQMVPAVCKHGSSVFLLESVCV